MTNASLISLSLTQVGAHIHHCTKVEYTKVGIVTLEEQLRGQGLSPCMIPVGGSNSLVCWGYGGCAQAAAADWGA